MIKSKPCTVEGCTYPRFGKGYCKKHQYLRDDIKKSINKQSAKRLVQNKKYLSLRSQYLKKHDKCEAGCGRNSTEIHHKRHDRTNDNLNDVTQFMAVCRECHRKIHENPNWAKQQKFLVK